MGKFNTRSYSPPLQNFTLIECRRQFSFLLDAPKFGKVDLLSPMKVQLVKIAHARSGDKGDTANVGLIALRPEFYPTLAREVSAAAVKAHFGDMVKGEVERFELPNLNSLNFLLHGSLGGGGTKSLMTDAQGKTFSTALLRMQINLSDTELGLLG